MFTEKSTVDEKDLVLVDTQELGEKCGKCGETLTLKVFYNRDNYQQKIECKGCGLAVWKIQ